jgi:hypothetical protein
LLLLLLLLGHVGTPSLITAAPSKALGMSEQQDKEQQPQRQRVSVWCATRHSSLHGVEQGCWHRVLVHISVMQKQLKPGDQPLTCKHAPPCGHMLQQAAHCIHV